MLMALGYRDEAKDWNLPLPKVRKPMNELITYL
jgi:nitroreductase